MATLTMSFNGICTHFSHIAGVPHRVVLPNAQAVHFGAFTWTNTTSGTTSIEYCLMPHFPVLSQRVTTGNFIVSGVVRKPVRLALQNATGPAIQWLENYALVPSLAEYIPEYRPSNDVVLGARAACHFDLFHGVVTAQEAPTGAVRVVVTNVETSGPPSFSVSPLAGGDPETLELSSDTDEFMLEVWNTEIPLPNSSAGPYDFLLHYLTGERGIPNALEGHMPGMPPQPTPFTGDDVAANLSQLASWAAIHGWPYHPDLTGTDSPSCSDSRYP